MISQPSKPNTWLDRSISFTKVNWEMILFAVIIVAAIATRFFDLGVRVMSHDESMNTYYSWLYTKGFGYQHTPMMHGPLQFHLLALIFNLFGDYDFTARIPAALVSVASVIFIWQYRRYLGRIGTIITAGLFVISPYMLYYGRYVRNEAFVVFFGLIGLWGILRYLDTGKNKYLYILVTILALHFAAKETAFIYLTQTLFFLGLVFIYQTLKSPWKSINYRTFFIAVMAFVLFSTTFGLGYAFVQKSQINLLPGEIIPPVSPETFEINEIVLPQFSPVTTGIILGGVIILGLATFFLFKGYGSENLRKLRSFDLLTLLGSLMIPQLSALPIRLLGWNPLNYYDTQNLLPVTVTVFVMIGFSALIGLWWKPKIWLVNNAIFYGIFVMLFTSLFTNGVGFFTGLVGSLGYWLVQQGAESGYQPLYYYILVQIPFYEYLAACGTLLAAGLGWRYFLSRRTKFWGKTLGDDNDKANSESQDQSLGNQRIAILLFGFWTISSLLAYTIVGVKMPWLTVHITLSMLLLSGWALGQLVDRIPWSELREINKWVALILLPLLLMSLISVFTILATGETPFAGKTIEQLKTTNTFIFTFIIMLISIWGLLRVLRSWDWRKIFSLAALIFFVLISILTIRTAFRASYKNYDQATELLVYAHSAGGVKDVIKKIEEISLRTTDSLSIEVALYNDTTWPLKWYLRNYPNAHFFKAEPTREIRNFPIILAGEDKIHKIEPIVGESYDQSDYIYLWWPMQDYFGLTWAKIRSYLSNPDLRYGILQIWLNGDYSAYGEATERDLSLSTWSPAYKLRMYIHNDLVADFWDYSVGAYTVEAIIDPYEGKEIQLTPDTEIRWAEDGTSLFNAPRGIAIAPDGSLYVADSRNNRIVHLKDGKVINTWGELSIPIDDVPPDGSFSEPWGVAVSPDGQYVYVADTWNHRIQKFTSQGKHITSWGYFGQNEDSFAFWGPRDIAIDSEGNLYVTNTGNKRINAFSPQGEFLFKFGSVGYTQGQFDEPVGIAIDTESDLIFVADTWNQRIQAFQREGPPDEIPVNVWDVSGWYGKGLDNKPYLAIGPDGNLYVTDPELSRILVFQINGEFINFFGNFETNYLGTPIGITSDRENGIWISDSKNNRLLHFTLPQ